MSNRLTFSLASLIFLIALGLVFVPTAVMAHDAEQTGDPATVGPHSHPQKKEVTAVTADPTANPPVVGRLAIPIHGAHPTVMLSLKPNAATVKGTEVIVTDATGGTTDVVTLIAQFNMPAAASTTETAINATDLLIDAIGDFTVAIRNNEGTLITDALTLGTVVRTDATTGTKATKLEVPLTVPAAAIPTGSGATEKFTLQIKVNQGVVFGLQQSLPSDDGFTDITVPGGASQASAVQKFTLVSKFTEVPDTTKPTVVVKAPTAVIGGDGDDANKLQFTITFSEKLASQGRGMFTEADITITGGTAEFADDGEVDDDTDFTVNDAGTVYTLKVTRANLRIAEVTVTVGDVIDDAAGNPLDADGSTLSATYMRPDTGNTPPYFVSGASVPNIKLWKGFTYSSGVLPTARDSEPDRITYKVMPALPAGFELVHDSASNWYIDVKEANKGMTVATPSTATTAQKTYKFIADDGTDDSQPLSFTIEVFAPVVPTAPTMVMAMEEGYVADPVDRETNTNHVMVSWTAPVDTMYADVHPAGTAFGSPITGYKVVQTNPDGTTMVTYPKAGAAKIMANATSYVTAPPALALGEYTFQVVAVNAVGDGAKSTVTDASKAIVLDTPSEPRDLRAAAGEVAGSVALNWKVPTNEGDADGRTDDGLITDYQILVVDADGEESKEEAGDNDLTYQVDELEAGRYVFRVSAINKDGVGESSDSTEFVVNLPGTADPTNAAPQFAADAAIASIVATVGKSIDGRVLPEATDADADDTLTYAIEDANGMATASPGGLTFNASLRTLTGMPSAEMAQMTYVYKVSDGKGGSDTIPFFITVNAATAGPPATSTPTASIPAKGFVVYVRDLDNRPHFGTSNPMVAEWSAMPNLHDLFMNQGGSLRLNAAADIVFSEVMWAVDEGKVGQDSYDGNQWFEIHNRTDAAVALSTITFTAKEGRPALDVGADRISNVVGGGDKWIRTKGQNGNSGAADGSGQKEFISMYRTRYDREGWLGRDWGKSSQVYHPNHKGTPGVGENPGPKTFTTSTVALGTVFNEISNSSTGAHEWIELRKRDGELSNLEKWVVHMVHGASGRDVASNPTQTKLFQLPKLNDGRYGDILLITRTDPARDDSHPLRGGYNVEVADADQANEGRDPNIRYYVADDWTTDLPDSGEFVLILRHGNDKTNHEKIQDIAGYHPNLKVERSDFFSNLWPLINYPAPDIALNKIEAGKVHRRQKDNIAGTRTVDRKDNAGHVALRDVGWTGVGYKRNADASAKNGGTPGYPNGALQSNETSASGDPVIISEIMYATGDRGNIPQWIELRNTSQTVGVNLDGWRITIVNHDLDNADGTTYPDDLVKRYTINGKIPPGQTFLVTAHSGTDNTNLPPERIVPIRNRRGDRILSQYGFEITLETKGKDNKDANRKLADKVGNLAAGADARVRGNPQSYANPAWMLPAGTNEDGDRVSIVRADTDGLEAASWKSFNMSAHLNAPESTYYGNRNDLSSPGYTVDSVLPVSLSKFRPVRLETGEVVVRWVTESETNNAGFNILRGEKLDGEFTKLNTKLIAGKGTTSEKNGYEFVDTSAKPNVVYYYQIQDVSLDGDVVTLKTTHLRGNISIVGKLTTTWGKLKALQ